jgi:hypothetical protein
MGLSAVAVPAPSGARLGSASGAVPALRGVGIGTGRRAAGIGDGARLESAPDLYHELSWWGQESSAQALGGRPLRADSIPSTFAPWVVRARRLTMPGKPKTPGLVIAAAVLLFIYGGLMLTCSSCGVAQMVMVAAAPAPQQEDLLAQERELTKRIPSYAPMEACAHVFNIVLGVIMIVAGFGALYLQPFARFAGSGAMAADLLMTCSHGTYTAVVVFPVNDQILEEQMQNAPIDLVGMFQAVTWGSLAFGFVFTLVFCVLILWFLNAKKSRDAFAGKFELDSHEERLARFDAFDDNDDEEDDYRRPRPASPKAPGDTGIKDKLD